VLFFIGQAVAQAAVATPFSLIDNNISDLGATTCGPLTIGDYRAEVCSPWHPVMNATFVLSGVLTAPPGNRGPALGRTLRAVAGQARTWTVWVGAALFLVAVFALAPIDARLWGGVALPAVTAPTSPVVLLPGAAVPLAVASLLLVNGLFVPLVEERLWRGLIQPGLRTSWGLVPGVLAASLLFSLKHVIVDASLGRLLALTAGGLVLGAVALRAGGPAGERTGWRTPAVSHAAGNTVATLMFLVATLGR
jgi:membrane protease YdiL (CAAX protease family)